MIHHKNASMFFLCNLQHNYVFYVKVCKGDSIFIFEGGGDRKKQFSKNFKKTFFFLKKTK